MKDYDYSSFFGAREYTTEKLIDTAFMIPEFMDGLIPKYLIYNHHNYQGPLVLQSRDTGQIFLVVKIFMGTVFMIPVDPECRYTRALLTSQISLKTYVDSYRDLTYTISSDIYTSTVFRAIGQLQGSRGYYEPCFMPNSGLKPQDYLEIIRNVKPIEIK